jgi:hypothetical protein
MGQLFNERATGSKLIKVEAMPDSVISNATTPQQVGKNKLLRIKGVAGTFLSFRSKDTDNAVPAVGDNKTYEMDDGFFYIRSQDQYVITSAAVRIEVIPD